MTFVAIKFVDNIFFQLQIQHIKPFDILQIQKRLEIAIEQYTQGGHNLTWAHNDALVIKLPSSYIPCGKQRKTEEILLPWGSIPTMQPHQSVLCFHQSTYN